MASRVLCPKKNKRAKPAPPKRYTPKKVGAVGNVLVNVDPALGAEGQTLAEAVLATAQEDYDRVAALFGADSPPSVSVNIEGISPDHDGTGGAWHTTCGDTVFHVDACFADPSRTSALFVAEFAEVLMALGGESWDCGASPGEGLSRFVAEWAYPDALQDFETASAWLDGSRGNVIDNAIPSDTDDQSNGGSVLFLWWLVTLGHSPEDICRAPGATLAATYTAVTGHDGGWDHFSKEVAAAWPAGKPSGVTCDNPWGSVPPPPPPGGGTEGIALTLGGDVSGGDYVLLPKNHALADLVRLGTPDPELLAVLNEVIASILTHWPSHAIAATKGPAKGPAKGK